MGPDEGFEDNARRPKPKRGKNRTYMKQSRGTNIKHVEERRKATEALDKKASREAPTKVARKHSCSKVGVGRRGWLPCSMSVVQCCIERKNDCSIHSTGQCSPTREHA
mmetsp:Transcript_245/g.549  ORF Transcript_245/g.549 Transcript_245/m.549 type:complete len:108 (-) Transcript_245:94-417(-)